MYQRPQLAHLIARLRESPRSLILVSGPRQIGKTTMVRQALDALRRDMDGIYRSADNPSAQEPAADEDLMRPVAIPGMAADGRWLIEQWTQARARLRRSGQRGVLVLDEIQKIPRWSDIVKGLWDEDRANAIDLHVVLLGSAPLLMQQGLTESLAGRFEPIPLTHWSFTEMREAFGLSFDQYVYFGGYPGSIDLIHDEPRWRAYVQAALISPNIERDILHMTRVDKPALLRRVFDLSCAYSGQILAYSNMVGQLQDAGNTTTVAHYLQLLRQAGLVAGLHKYEARRARQRASSPKLAVFNTALQSATTDYDFRSARADRSYWGRLVESAVGAHLLNSRETRLDIGYWRQSNREVDFVLSRGDKRLAIEVKSGTQRTSTWGLDAFQKAYGNTRSLLVGADGVPLETFLSYSADYWLDEV